MVREIKNILFELFVEILTDMNFGQESKIVNGVMKTKIHIFVFSILLR